MKIILMRKHAYASRNTVFLQNAKIRFIDNNWSNFSSTFNTKWLTFEGFLILNDYERRSIMIITLCYLSQIYCGWNSSKVR